jgi:hypothetical protein
VAAFDVELNDYLFEDIATPPLPNLPQPTVNTQANVQNVDPTTNLTSTETALLSPEEQVIRAKVKENNIMVKKSALQKIESHEKLCRIMQKQTFEQIKEMQDRIKRLEYWIVGGMGAVLITLLTDVCKIMELTRNFTLQELTKSDTAIRKGN